ncbi:hypothetical protein E1B28_009542 [Marasmius oreades]|uniref:F-box domain-containing protein n=1 Tax=Marasmius oreades TaxID=181124 RepID=A0A9P7UQK0_9AGAR|nr:uncharacterized protein E1B28_009542 [Marasmius oreades]KAG7090423.1 hypothetical protein E1B28_009542 [Marasmius oreades]
MSAYLPSDVCMQMPDSSSSQCRRCSLDNVEASRSRFPGPSDSLFERYKNCNVYPLVHEADSIKAEMGGAMWREYLLDARIVQLHSTIASLTAEKSRIKEVVEKYRLILRPVLRLPPELLTRIFAFTEDCSTPQDKDKDRYNENQPPSSLDSSRMPWALAQVCRLWRNLSLATPSLWRFVSVTSKVFEQSDDGYIENAPGIIQAQVYRLSLQLQRSGEYPLDVFSSVRNSTAGIVNPLLSLTRKSAI